MLGIDGKRRFPAERFSRSGIKREHFGVEIVVE
jgi:hypothetical protein